MPSSFPNLARRAVAESPVARRAGRQRARRLPALLAVAMLLGGPGPGWLPAAWAQPVAPDSRNTLPALGDSVSEDISVGTERRIGDRIMRDIRRDPEYLDDPVLLAYLQPMFAKLIAASRARGNIPAELDEHFAWELFLVRERTVNAFALPGGYIGVHLALIAMTAAPDELASVLAHELSHITQRHIARSVAASKKTSLAGIAGLLLGVLAASRSPEAAQALITGGQAVAMQGQLNFSRDMEREADRVGFGVMTAAGYSPAGMASMFERLQQASRLNDSQNYPYLRTHPLTAERIGEARSRMGTASESKLDPPLVYALIRARARVLMDPRDAALQREQQFDSASALANAATPADKLGALYGSALASLLRHDPARADAALAQARSLAAGDAAATQVLDLLGVRIMIARGDAAAAQAAVARMLAAPGGQESRPLLLEQADAALMPGAGHKAADSAAERLQTWTALHGGDALAWGSLSQLWQKLDQPLRAVRAEAESHAALGDVQGALDRLRAGQQLAKGTGHRGADYIEASVIDARLRELEAKRRQIAAEERGES